jgi:hypothetical protein
MLQYFPTEALHICPGMREPVAENNVIKYESKPHREMATAQKRFLQFRFLFV